MRPADGSIFRAGDAIDYAGTGTDPQDGNLPPSAFTWTILFHHEGHVHPGGTFTNTKTGTLTIPTSGHDFEGNTSAYATGPTFKPIRFQEASATVTYTGSWSTTTSSSASGGHGKTANRYRASHLS